MFVGSHHKVCAIKVCAIVVTYNRIELLSECLDSLLKLSQNLSRIIVVDNASTDATRDILDQKKKLDDRILPIHLPTNTGGAGGFATGLKIAMEQTDADWFWVMDDDVEAFPDALEGLLKYTDKSECIHGRRCSPEGVPYYWESWFIPQIGFSLPKPDSGFKNGKKTTEVNVACFEGMLISRNLVNKIGLPDSRYFIAWDDTTYGYLASHHTKMLYVDHMTLKRKRPLKSIQLGFRTLNESSDMYRYYHIRNRGLLKRYLQVLGKYSAIPFFLMTWVLVFKELIRAAILQKDLKAFKSLWKGYKDQKLFDAAPIDLPKSFFTKENSLTTSASSHKPA
jgi:GT2 family glycosyltransferase